MSGIAGVKRQRPGALGIGGGKQHAHRPTLGDAEQRGAFGAHCIHDRADIVHALFEMSDADMPVGEAGAAFVEQDQPGKRSQAGKELSRAGRPPSQLDVGNEARNEDQVKRAVADHLVGNVHIAAFRVACFRRCHGGLP